MKFPKIPPVVGHRKTWEENAWDKLVKQFTDLSATELKSLLEIITSPKERANILKRTAVIDQLIHGRSFRKISGELWVSLQTINSIKRGLKSEKFSSYSEYSKTTRKHFIDDGGPLPPRERPDWQTSKFKFPKKGGGYIYL